MAKANNALAWITREAKRLKKQYPRRFVKWTDYVAQASAIYASKHKGRSPVGKKKSTHMPAKKTRRKKRVGASGNVTRSKSHTDYNRQKTYITIGSVNKSKKAIRDKLEKLIGQEEVKKFKAKKKALQRKISKKISTLKSTYRKLL